MARRKRESSGGGGGDWLNTYADMVTLLLTFFILLFSMSSLDSAKFNMLVTAFASDKDSAEKIIIRGETTGENQTASNANDSENAPEEVSLEDLFQLVKSTIEEQGLEGSVDVAKGDNFVIVRFMDNMLFEPNSAILKPQDQEILDFVGSGIKSVQDQTVAINIVGHTAAIPDNPDYAVSDRKLSSDRANVVLMRFEDVIGIDPQKLFSTGYGKWKPIATNETPEGQSQNRRVEILLSSEGTSLSEQLDNAYEKLVE